MPGPPAAAAGDPVATKTRWEPLRGGGANFRTRALVAVNPARFEFQPSAGLRIFAGVFVTLGVAAAVVGGVNGARLMPVIGAGLCGLTAGLLHFGAVPWVFDRSLGAYWRGRGVPGPATKIHGTLAEIHALQILPERVRSDDGSYTSYELNLVLTDGRRFNVADHSDYDSLRRDADTLGRFLQRPVWDTVAAAD